MLLTQENFNQKIAAHRHKRFLAAASGGADSMVMLHLFVAAGVYFEAAHVNYGLRGEDSDADQKTVEDFCKKNNIKLHTHKVPAAEKPENGGIQLWARNLRYNFFFKILNENHLDFIVTAHHLGDQMETFFINLSRGSGLRGLTGIPADGNRILRPLLDFSKQDIYDFAEKNIIDFREDLSNRKNDYLRNKFRNQIIPEIKTAAPNFEQGFSDSVDYLKQANAFIQSEIEDAFHLILIKKNDAELILDKAKLLALKPFLIKEILLKLGFRGEEIQKIIVAENGKMFHSKDFEIRMGREDILCLRRRKNES